MTSVSIEVGDTEYELEVESYTPGERPTRDNPGSGPEIELAATVKVWGLGFQINGPGSGNAVPEMEDVISLDEFMVIYAEHHCILDLAGVRSKIDEEVTEELERAWEEDHDRDDG